MAHNLCGKCKAASADKSDEQPEINVQEIFKTLKDGDMKRAVCDGLCGMQAIGKIPGVKEPAILIYDPNHPGRQEHQIWVTYPKMEKIQIPT